MQITECCRMGGWMYLIAVCPFRNTYCNTSGADCVCQLQQQQQQFYGPLSGTIQVSQYQKKHVPLWLPGAAVTLYSKCSDVAKMCLIRLLYKSKYCLHYLLSSEWDQMSLATFDLLTNCHVFLQRPTNFKTVICFCLNNLHCESFCVLV